MINLLKQKKSDFLIVQNLLKTLKERLSQFDRINDVNLSIIPLLNMLKVLELLCDIWDY
jgi:hypothetical protein